MLSSTMEGSAQVFAGEYAGSTLAVQDKDSGSPPFVVTPGGAWCRLLHLTGALTEVTETGEMVRARLADPTGVFDLVIGGRSPPCRQEILDIPVPSFVSVIGRAQMYRKNGTVVLSVRPDHVLVVDRAARDQWVLVTAESTICRLEQMHDALLGRCTDERILTPFCHYAVTRERLGELAVLVEGAVQGVLQGGSAPARPPVPDLVRELVQAGRDPLGTAVEEIIGAAASRGVARDAVLLALESLIREDECYQPRKGFVKPL